MKRIPSSFLNSSIKLLINLILKHFWNSPRQLIPDIIPKLAPRSILNPQSKFTPKHVPELIPGHDTEEDVEQLGLFFVALYSYGQRIQEQGTACNAFKGSNAWVATRTLHPACRGVFQPYYFWAKALVSIFHVRSLLVGLVVKIITSIFPYCKDNTTSNHVNLPKSACCSLNVACHGFHHTPTTGAHMLLRSFGCVSDWKSRVVRTCTQTIHLTNISEMQSHISHKHNSLAIENVSFLNT